MQIQPAQNRNRENIERQCVYTLEHKTIQKLKGNSSEVCAIDNRLVITLQARLFYWLILCDNIVNVRTVTVALHYSENTLKVRDIRMRWENRSIQKKFHSYYMVHDVVFESVCVCSIQVLHEVTGVSTIYSINNR